MAEINVVPKGGSNLWLWIVLAVAIAIVCWFLFARTSSAAARGNTLPTGHTAQLLHPLNSRLTAVRPGGTA